MKMMLNKKQIKQYELHSISHKTPEDYCRIQRNWRLGLSLSSEARCGRIFLKNLHNNLALINIHFCQLENFSDQRRFFWNVEKKKPGVSTKNSPRFDWLESE
jgi:hypothetical protein